MSYVVIAMELTTNFCLLVLVYLSKYLSKLFKCWPLSWVLFPAYFNQSYGLRWGVIVHLWQRWTEGLRAYPDQF